MSHRVFDCHSDIPSRVCEVYDDESADGIVQKDTVLEDEFLPDMRSSNIMGRVAAVYLKDVYIPKMATHRALNQIQYLKKEVGLIDDAEVVESVNKMKINSENNVMSFMIGMEGVEPLVGDIDLIDTFYDLGVRVVGLTHSRRNMAGDGPFIFKDIDIDEGGLSAFGLELIERMNKLGIVVDTAHINEKGFWNIVEKSSDPIINSHSIPRKYKDIHRNLSDEQMKAIADSGGVVSLNAVPIFHDSWPDRPDMDVVVDMVNHVVDVVGVEHVGFGFDFWGYLTHRYDDIDQSWSGVDGLDDDGDVGNLGDVLIDSGYSESEVSSILWDNNIRVLEDVID